jgi:hypothetical protein
MTNYRTRSTTYAEDNGDNTNHEGFTDSISDTCEEYETPIENYIIPCHPSGDLRLFAYYILCNVYDMIFNVLYTLYFYLRKYTVWFLVRLGEGAMYLFEFIMINLDRKRVILDRDSNEPYLERYYLFLKDRGESFPFNIFIHNILLSDPTDLHDHPWGYFTLILKGGYWEHMPNQVSLWRRPGYWQSVPANWQHRLELDKNNGSCWTLFIPRMRARKWGFLKNNKWIEADQYFKERDPKKSG